MTDAEPQKLGLLAKLVVAFILVMIVAGIVWHGVSIETFKRIWHQLIERADAPMRFRFILQPLMAAIAAILRWPQGRADRPLALSSGPCCATRASASNGWRRD